MKTTQVILRFDVAKLKALQYYLPQNGTSVEEELKNHLEEIYNDQVPDSVKDFLKFQSNESSMENKTNKQEANNILIKKQKRSTQKADAAVEEAPAMIQSM